MEQSETARVLELLRVDGEMVVWWATRIECWSALSRMERESMLTSRDVDAANKRLATLAGAWYEIAPVEEARLQARRLLRRHPLRAADALQLAAALLWSGSDEGRELITFDVRLRDAARMEGFIT